MNTSFLSSHLVRSALLSQALGTMALTGCEFRAGALSPDASLIDAPDVDAALPALPMPVLPAVDQVLPPTRAFLNWKEAGAPVGRTIASYDVCFTTGPLSAIDEDGECPGSSTAMKPWFVLDPLQTGSPYFWKVRARYDNGETSAFSAVATFSTDDSLVAWWRLDGNAMDSGPSGSDGNVQGGASFMGGVDKQGFHGDGVNDVIDVGGFPALQGPLSVSAWFFGEGIPTSADSGILNEGSLNYALTYHTDGQVYFYLGDGGNHLKAPAAANAWHHVFGTFDGTVNADGLKLYLDGAAAGKKASSRATSGATGSLSIGKYATSFFHGSIDNVTVYNKVQSEGAVLNEYCATQAAGGVDPLPAACHP